MAQNQISAESLSLFDSLMDATPEVLELLPEYKAYAAGTYLCKLKCDPKEGAREINGNVYMGVEFVAEEDCVRSLGEDHDPADIPNPGDTCSILFNMSDEMGRGRLRNFLVGLKASMGRADEDLKNSEILGMADGQLVIAAFKKPREKDDKKYANFSGLEFVG